MEFRKRLQDIQRINALLKSERAAHASAYRVPPNPEHAQTAADQLDWLCRQHEASYLIARQDDGNVVVLFQYPSGDVVSSGVCHSVPLAVFALRDKIIARGAA